MPSGDATAAMRRRTDRLIIGCTAISVLCAIVVFVVAPTVLITNSRSDRNSEAIYKGCVLLSNKIIESGGQAAGGKILVREILLNAEEHGRPEVVLQYRRAIRGVKPLEPLNCRKVARKPQSIRELPTPTPPPQPPTDIPPDKR